MINSLPSDLLVDVLSRVASSSFTDLFNSKLCCRDFRGAAEEECVLEQVSMVGFPVIHQWLKSEKVSWFLNQCVQIGNPEALYRQGMVTKSLFPNLILAYLTLNARLEKLRRASEKGHAEASYVYGIILVCMGGQSSVEGLKLLNAMKGSTTSQSTRFAIFQDCRKRIEAVIRAICRDIRRAAEEEYILEQVSIMGFPVNQWRKSEEVSLFLNRCVKGGNPEALYRQGMVTKSLFPNLILAYLTLNARSCEHMICLYLIDLIVSSMRMESGFEKLRRASEKGHSEASYVYGIILVCKGGQSSVEGLKLLNAMKSGTTSQSTRFAIFQECRKRIEAVIRSMWINNHLEGRQSRSCCHENTSRLKETWDGRREVEDDASCEACKLNGIGK
ncbi:hypothetical protein C3L33_13896, partial [Rhododendron williamsianum]